MKKLNFMVLSDLHCHPSNVATPHNTILYTDALRHPSTEHPIQNLLEKIVEFDLKANILICPGDLTDKANKQGLMSGWGFIKEISAAFDNIPVFSTIGNHDIDSRLKDTPYSYTNVRGVSAEFPLPQKYITKFWADGYSLIEEEDYVILVVNSCHHHTHGDSKVIEHGKLTDHQIEQIKGDISNLSQDERIKILLVHHHPIQHERAKLGEDDFIENGENLMQIIAQNNFDLIIHGHKHDPWLRYYLPKGSSKKIPVFSSGSFSALNQKMWADIGNYVHFFEIEKHNGETYGKISTYTFQKRSGWVFEKTYFYPLIGFGNTKSVRELITNIKDVLKNKGQQLINFKELVSQIKELEHLTPDEIEELKKELSDNSIDIPYLGTQHKPQNVVYYYGED